MNGVPVLSVEAAGNLARGLAWARMALGTGALVAPGLAGLLFSGLDAASPANRALSRAMGGRDLALGLGAVLAMSHGAPARGWVEAGALADAADVLAAVASWRGLPRWGRLAIVAMASGGTAAGVVAARAMEPRLVAASTVGR